MKFTSYNDKTNGHWLPFQQYRRFDLCKVLETQSRCPTSAHHSRKSERIKTPYKFSVWIWDFLQENENSKYVLTGLSGTMCLPTGRPMPERRRREEATERLTTPFPPMIREATLLNLPAISALDLPRSSFFYVRKYCCCCQPIFTAYLVIFPSVCELTNFSN